MTLRILGHKLSMVLTIVTNFAEMDQVSCLFTFKIMTAVCLHFKIYSGTTNCDMEHWWAKFRIQDEDSGLHLVKVEPTGKQTYKPDSVYYR